MAATTKTSAKSPSSPRTKASSSRAAGKKAAPAARKKTETAPAKAEAKTESKAGVKKTSKLPAGAQEFSQRKDLRAWLKLHAATSKTVKVITPSRESGLPRVTPEELQEELLCFGWVGTDPVRFDDQRVLAECSPRKPKDPWTRTQKEKIKKLTTLRMMTPAGQSMVDLAKRTGTWDAPESPDDLKVPLDLRSALSGTSNAREYWESFDRSTRREIVEWIVASKTIEIRERRIQETVAKAAKNEVVALKS